MNGFSGELRKLLKMKRYRLKRLGETGLGRQDGPRLMIDLNPATVAGAFVRRSALAKLVFALNGLAHPAGIRGGDWDRRAIPIESHPTYRLMHDLMEREFDPKRCFEALFVYFRDKGRSREKALLKAKAQLHEYVLEYRRLYESMRDRGYVSGLAADEVGVAVGREGTMIKVPNGNHRFYTAVALGMEQVPAEVRFVHAAWYRRHAEELRGSVIERTCEALRRSGLSGCRIVKPGEGG